MSVTAPVELDDPHGMADGDRYEIVTLLRDDLERIIRDDRDGPWSHWFPGSDGLPDWRSTLARFRDSLHPDVRLITFPVRQDRLVSSGQCVERTYLLVPQV